MHLLITNKSVLIWLISPVVVLIPELHAFFCTPQTVKSQIRQETNCMLVLTTIHRVNGGLITMDVLYV